MYFETIRLTYFNIKNGPYGHLGNRHYDKGNLANRNQETDIIRPTDNTPFGQQTLGNRQ
jgi:hypothetical protein